MGEIVGAVTRGIRARQTKNPDATQTVAAERLGLSRQRVSSMINNPGNWTLETIADLIHAFDLQIEEMRVVLEEDLVAETYNHPLSQKTRVKTKSSKLVAAAKAGSE
jgi:plasmid maintenance system antidote protein VapI